jgi:hypothetical protein
MTATRRKLLSLAANAAGASLFLCFVTRSQENRKHLLAAYREALSDYHLHAEGKFLNAEPFDHGRTIRQPVKASAIEQGGRR